MQPEPLLRPVRVWDLPTRLFHWTLALAVIGAVVTAKVGGNAMVWHMRLGLLVLALLAFRLVWGFAGGHWSRFANILHGPRNVLAFVRGDAGPAGRFEVGHSPTGAWSVIAMLAALAVQVATGLVADDEIATTGPLYRFASADMVSTASSWHKDVGQYLVIGLALLHVGAVLYYLWRKRRNLILPMVHGDKALAADVPASADGAGQRALAFAVAGVAIALAWWIGSLGAA